MAINSPVIKLKGMLDGLISFVRTNYNDTVDKSTTWLYENFNDVEIDGTNFNNELVNLLVTNNKKSPDFLDTRIMYEQSRAAMPTIHLHVPSETKEGVNSVGMGIGGQSDFVGVTSVYKNCYTRSYRAEVDLIVTGKTSMQVLVLYEFLKALFQANPQTLNYCFDSFDYSGKELMANTEIVPYNTMYRALGISVTYKTTVTSIITNSTGTSINFEGDPQDEIE